jgi:TPR repeat protein
MRELGWRYLGGFGVGGDEEAGVALFRQAVEAGDMEAMLNLGLCYRDGRGVPLAHSQAALWFWRGADSNHWRGWDCRRELHALAFAPI